MPRVEIVQKHNTSARRLFIQGTNGKVRNLGIKIEPSRLPPSQKCQLGVVRKLRHALGGVEEFVTVQIQNFSLKQIFSSLSKFFL